MRTGRWLPVAVGPLALLAACMLAGCMTSAEYTADADAEVGSILTRAQADVLDGREDFVLQPEPSKEPPPTPPAEPAPEAEDSDTAQPGAAGDDRSGGRASEEELTAPLDSQSPDALRLDLRTSLQTAVTTGREFIDRRESLYLQGLSLSLVRYNFGPLLNSTVALVWNDAEGEDSSLAATGDLSASQILDSGGIATVGGSLGLTHVPGISEDGEDIGDSQVFFDLSQPLMRGSGYLVSHEALTQAEREMVYEVRDFELFREDFAIGVAQDYFDLVRSRQRIANLEQSWRDAVFDRRKTAALRQLDRSEDQDVFLSRRREIDAENTLLEARTNYKVDLDRFKIRLGLTTSSEVAIVDEEPPYEPVKVDQESAVSVAMHNRLDLLTARDRLEDTQRGVIIAEDGLRPDLGLSVGYGLRDSPELGKELPEDWEASAALTYEVPLNRQAERNVWRAALIGLDRARRDLQLLFDDVERDVRNQLRVLKQTEQQIELQREQITQEQRAVAVMQIRYESGGVGSRDLLDARQSLVDAQNDLVDLLARHVILRLTLLRTLGVLFLDEQGMWKT